MIMNKMSSDFRNAYYSLLAHWPPDITSSILGASFARDALMAMLMGAEMDR